MPTWTVKADRDDADYSALANDLRSYGESIQGLQVRLVGAEEFQAQPTTAGFRTFAAVAAISHPDVAALQMVAQELISTYGWLIDLSHDPPPGPHKP